MRTLEGGCQVPIGGYARLEAGKIHLKGFVGDADGSRTIRDAIVGDAERAVDLGKELAGRMIENGANDLLEATRRTVEKMPQAVI